MTDFASLVPTGTTAQERAGDADTAVLPVGSFEQHGPHLPLATDTVIACSIVDALGAAHPLRRLPPVTISCSHEHEGWPGTVSITAATLSAVVSDIAASLRRGGLTRLVLVNGHGGNYVLGNIVQEVAGDGLRVALFPDPADWESALARAGVQTSAWSDMHAGEAETSVLLHTHPHLVGSSHASADRICDDRRHLLTLGLTAYTASGVIGRPSLASATKGRAILDHLVESFGEYLRALTPSPEGDAGAEGAHGQ